MLPHQLTPLAVRRRKTETMLVTKVSLSLTTNDHIGIEPLRGIKEQPAWTEQPRLLLLCDGTGTRQAEVRIPDRNLTPRVVELLGMILDDIEYQQHGGGPIKLEP